MPRSRNLPRAITSPRLCDAFARRTFLPIPRPRSLVICWQEQRRKHVDLCDDTRSHSSLVSRTVSRARSTKRLASRVSRHSSAKTTRASAKKFPSCRLLCRRSWYPLCSLSSPPRSCRALLQCHGAASVEHVEQEEPGCGHEPQRHNVICHNRCGRCVRIRDIRQPRHLAQVVAQFERTHSVVAYRSVARELVPV